MDSDLNKIILGVTPDYLVQMALEVEKKRIESLSSQLNKLTGNNNMIENLIVDAPQMVDASELVMDPTVDSVVGDVQEQSVNKAVIENVDNVVLANIVADKVIYEFANMVLVKPMDVEMVFKTLTVPEDSGEKDEEGEPVMQMTIKQIETESLLRKGVVLATPASFKATEGKEGMLVLNVGDIVVYPNKRSIDFDLFKDSALVPYYEILAKVA